MPVHQNCQGPLSPDNQVAAPRGTLVHWFWNQARVASPSASAHEDSETQTESESATWPAPPGSLFSYLSSKSNTATAEPETTNRYKIICPNLKRIKFRIPLNRNPSSILQCLLMRH